MARYTSRSFSRRTRRKRKRTYRIIALLIIAVLIVIIFFNPFAKKNTSLPLDETNLGNQANTDIVKLPELTPKPKPQPKPKSKSQPKPQPAPELPQVTIKPVAEPNVKVTELINEAVELAKQGPSKTIEARYRFNDLLSMPMNSHQQVFIKKQMSELADKWLFSPKVLPQDTLCSNYRVQPGDQLRNIGRQFNVPYEIIKKINNISHAEALQAGQIIKVINGPFHVRVYRSTFTMDLFLKNTFVRTFPVGLGKPGRETPTGLWIIEPGGKLVKPTWTDPDTGKTYIADDPDYPLGSRWIKLKGLEGEAVGRTGIAFHGTNDPNRIDTQVSRGCIRLYNGDVILIYNLLMPGHSKVEVVD